MSQDECYTADLVIAKEHYQNGDHNLALRHCEQILQKSPKHTDTLMLKGLVELSTAQWDQAIQSYFLILQDSPKQAEALNNLGSALMQKGDFKAAINSYYRAIAIKPDYASAYNNLGTTLLEQGEVQTAIKHFQTAVKLKPSFIKAHNNLASCFLNRGEVQEALKTYEVALKHAPNNTESLILFAHTLMHCEEWRQALGIFGKLCTLQAEQAAHYYYLGLCFKNLGLYPQAIHAYKITLDLDRTRHEYHNEMGNAYFLAGEYKEALKAFRKALKLRANSPGLHNNIGKVLSRLHEYDSAEQHLKEAIRLLPDYAEAYHNLATVYYFQKQLKKAIDTCHAGLEKQKNFPGLHHYLGQMLFYYGDVKTAIQEMQIALDLKGEDSRMMESLLFYENYLPHISPQERLAKHLKWGESITQQITPVQHPPQLKKKTLKIGYVSADIRMHAVSFFLRPILQNHSEACEIYLYANVDHPDEVTTELKSYCQYWRNIYPLHDHDVAQMILNDGIDILIDLSGHTSNNRLKVFAYQAAPIQVSYLGYPGTTGLKTIQYRLTDAWADPLNSPKDCSETLIRLPNGFLCYAPSKDAPEVNALPALTNKNFTFASLNNVCKITPEVVRVWAEILKQVPNSRLTLKSNLFIDPFAQNKLIHEFANRGIQKERLNLLSESLSTSKHLERYNDIDLALDPFPYNGTTTSCEALWMGVPVVTLQGQTHATRVGSSLLNQLGISACITDNVHDYVKCAVSLATNSKKLAEMRSTLRKKMQNSTLCDAENFTQDLEKQYFHLHSLNVELAPK